VVEEWRHDQRCLFQQGNLQKQTSQTRKAALGFNPGEDIFCIVENNDGRI
jgi:hypothetical protein